MRDRMGHSAMLGGEVLRVLGLDPFKWNVTRIVIEVGESPYVEIRRMLTELEGQEITTRLHRVSFGENEPA